MPKYTLLPLKKQVQEKAKVQTDHKETKEQILEFHRAARAELKKVQNKSEEIREQELKDRAEKYIEEGKLPAGKALKILIEQEKSAREYGSIQRELDRKKYASLMRLIVPGEKYVDAEGNMAETPNMVYTDKDNIHDRLITRYIKHFSEA